MEPQKTHKTNFRKHVRKDLSIWGIKVARAYNKSSTMRKEIPLAYGSFIILYDSRAK